MKTDAGKPELGHPTLMEVSKPTLEADGIISVYEIETGDVVAQYEGLAIHRLVEACKKLHTHPSTESNLDIGDHHLVDSAPLHDVLRSLAYLDRDWASKRVLYR